MSGRVVVAGGIAVEQTVRWEDLPGGAGVRFARPVGWAVGGPAAIAAVAAAAAGAATRCVGVVGTDPAGGVVRQRLARADVDVTTVIPLPGLTGRILRRAGVVPPPVVPTRLTGPTGRAWLRIGRDARLDALDRRDPFDALNPQGGLDPRGSGSFHVEDTLEEERDEREDADEVLVLPGASWGPGDVATEHALARCEPGDVLLVEWSSLEGTGDLVAAAYDLDVQIVALLAPYPLLPQSLDLPRVDVALVDQRGAMHLADAGELPGSLCVSVGGGLAWDGATYTSRTDVPLEEHRRHAILAGALAGRLACGDDRAQAAEAALAMLPASLAGGTWRHLPLQEDDLA